MTPVTCAGTSPAAHACGTRSRRTSSCCGPACAPACCVPIPRAALPCSTASFLPLGKRIPLSPLALHPPPIQHSSTQCRRPGLGAGGIRTAGEGAGRLQAAINRRTRGPMVLGMHLTVGATEVGNGAGAQRQRSSRHCSMAPPPTYSPRAVQGAQADCCLSPSLSKGEACNEFAYAK